MVASFQLWLGPSAPRGQAPERSVGMRASASVGSTWRRSAAVDEVGILLGEHLSARWSAATAYTAARSDPLRASLVCPLDRRPGLDSSASRR